jgi:flagellar hook-length control protein FliK
MAIPDVLLKAVRSSAPTGKNPLEALTEAPFSSSEGSSFSAVMAEVNVDARKADENEAEKSGSETGKGLPELPDRSLNSRRLRSIADTDQNLEEFAVGMGIDRGLVRLLLSETAPVAGAVEAKAEEVSADVANPMIPSMTPMVQPATPMVLAVNASAATTPDQSVRPAVEEATAILGTTPMAGSTAMAGSTSITDSAPIADEDLLLWRSSLLAAPMGDDAAAPVEGATSTATPALASTAEQLKVRAGAIAMPAPTAAGLAASAAATSGAVVKPPAITDMLDTMSPMDATSSVALPDESGWRSRRFNFVNDAAVQSPSASIASEGISKTDAGEFADFMDGGAGSGAERGGEMPTRPLVAPGMIVSMTAEPRPDVAPTSTATALLGNLSSPTSISLATGAPQGATSGETAMVLQTPDAKLSFGERVQAFADAVAQRVIGQIRDENWSVRMQLEPANLGTMDIDLSLKGNVVAATVGVANQDVRALLESGLPRLRESLESAGLQLSGWNFGQAGSRAFNDSARKFSQTVFRGRIDETGSVADVDGSRMMPIRNAASGKIDLFV